MRILLLSVLIATLMVSFSMAEVHISSGVLRQFTVISSEIAQALYGVFNGDGSQVYNGDGSAVTYQ